MYFFNQLISFRLVFSFSISFLLTFYLVPLFLIIAKKLNILDTPDGSVKVHEKPIPYLGGFAVYFGFITTLSLVFPFENDVFFMLLGSTMLLFTGLIDDILRLQAYQKFFWQFVAAFCFLKSGFYLKESFFLANMWNFPISLLWILSVVNAFNLVDVMDGLATLIACCATATLLVISLFFGQQALALLLACFLGSLFAFFCYNKPPAKIYLGDAGALFIGGMLATIPFLFKWGTFNSYGFFTPAIILAIPLLEITALILIRTYKGIPFYQASPDHFSIYLQHYGWSKYQILAFILLLSAIILIIAVSFSLNMLSHQNLAISISLLLIIWIFSICNNKKIFLFEQ